MNDPNDIMQRLEQLERENASLKKLNKQQNATLRGVNRLLKHGEVMLKEIKSTKIALNKDAMTFEQAFYLKCRDRHIMKHLMNFFDRVPSWGDITDESMFRLQTWLRTQQKRRGDGLLSETTIALYMTLLKGIIKFGYMARNNSGANVKVLKAAKEIKVWLNPNDLHKLCRYTHQGDEELYALKMCLISALTGARISDVELMNVANIQGNTLRYIPIKTKNFEACVPLSEQQINTLTSLLSINLDLKVNINPIIREICRKCGIDRDVNVGTPNRPKVSKLCDEVHVHTFRHSYATIKHRYGDLTERQLSDAMGHANISMTFNNYVLDKSPVSDGEKKEMSSFLFN